MASSLRLCDEAIVLPSASRSEESGAFKNVVFRLRGDEEEDLAELFVATRYGPSIRSLEQWLRMESERDVRALLILRDGSSPRMANPSRMQNHLDVLWTVYGRMSANQIQRITCLGDSPWSLCWRERHENLGDELIIPDDLIYSYFSRRTNRRRGTAAANQDAFSR